MIGNAIVVFDDVEITEIYSKKYMNTWKVILIGDVLLMKKNIV